MTGSYQIECKAGSEYTALLASGIVTLIIWGVATPIFLSLIIWKNTKASTNQTIYKFEVINISKLFIKNFK